MLEIDVSKRIKTIRERNGLTQTDVADKLGMERSNYSRLEKRGNDLSINQLLQIANALDVRLIDILFPLEIDAIRKGGMNTIKLQGVVQELQKRNDYLIENQRKMEVIMSFMMEFAKGVEGFGITEDVFRRQLDPEGKLEIWAKSKAADLLKELNDPEQDSDNVD